MTQIVQGGLLDGFDPNNVVILPECNCNEGSCLVKRCPCFAVRVRCSEYCTCTGCRNFEEWGSRKPRKQRPAPEVDTKKKSSGWGNELVAAFFNISSWPRKGNRSRGRQIAVRPWGHRTLPEVAANQPEVAANQPEVAGNQQSDSSSSEPSDDSSDSAYEPSHDSSDSAYEPSSSEE